nr:TetR family transcriptional regulator C-terminal domain-containing protein [Agromyces seonyuensis]
MTVLERDGLAGLSVRKVAAQAGLAPASLRRAFPSQNQLRAYCLTVIRERATARVRALRSTGATLAADLLRELLPLDATRRLEVLAQTQLALLALTDERLQPAAAELHAAVARACRFAIETLRDAGRFAESRNADDEAARLHALVDGLAIQGLWNPTGLDPRNVSIVLDAHLDELQRPTERRR